MRDDDVLLVRQADKVVPRQSKLSCQPCHAGERSVSDPSTCKCQANPIKPWLHLRVDAHVIGLLVARKNEPAVRLEFEAQARDDLREILSTPQSATRNLKRARLRFAR